MRGNLKRSEIKSSHTVAILKQNIFISSIFSFLIR